MSSIMLPLISQCSFLTVWPPDTSSDSSLMEPVMMSREITALHHSHKLQSINESLLLIIWCDDSLFFRKPKYAPPAISSNDTENSLSFCYYGSLINAAASMQANKPDGENVLVISVMAITQKIAAKNISVFLMGECLRITAQIDKDFLRVFVFQHK